MISMMSFPDMGRLLQVFAASCLALVAQAAAAHLPTCTAGVCGEPP